MGPRRRQGWGRGHPPGGLCLSSALPTGPFESPLAARLALLGGREVLSCSHPGAFPTFVISPGEVVSAQSSGGAQSSPPRPQTQLSNRRNSTPHPAPSGLWPWVLTLCSSPCTQGRKAAKATATLQRGHLGPHPPHIPRQCLPKTSTLKNRKSCLLSYRGLTWRTLC